ATAVRSRRSHAAKNRGAGRPIRARSLLLSRLVLGFRGAAWTLASIATILTATVGRAQSPTYLCAPAKVQRDGSQAASLAVVDRLGSRTIAARRAATACWATAPSAAMLEGFGTASRSKKSRRVGETV